MTRRNVDPQITAFLTSCRTASLATVDERGRPHAANLWYAMDGKGRLYFVSSLDSAHGRHIIRDPFVALTIYGHTDDPRHIHGLQIHGLCAILTPPPEGSRTDWTLAWKVFREKYPFLADRQEFREAVETQSFFRITPTWIRWVDNRKGFGFKVEKTMPLKRAGGRRQGKSKRKKR